MSLDSSPFEAIPEADRMAFYRTALAGLRFVEHRRATGRRFGADADARWRSLRGDLTAADRIDLLLRDADAEWPGAFSARAAFDMRAVAEDEPFGPGWESLEPVDAEELWREAVAAAPPAGIDEVVAAWGAAWRAWPVPMEVPQPQATDRLVLCGPGAVTACLKVFATGKDLDWADQVVCVATPPAHRQLAALATALLNLLRAAPLLAREENLPAAPLRLVISEDANPDDVSRARTAGEGAGA